MTAIHRSSQRRGFRDQLPEAGQSDLVVELMPDAFNQVRKAPCAAADAMEDEQVRSRVTAIPHNAR